jgi:hypothetical protein
MFFTGKVNRWVVAFLLAASGGVILFFYFLDPEKSIFFPKCPLYVWTGLYCPGCGSHFLLYPAGAFVLYQSLRPYLNRCPGVSLPDFLYRRNTPWIILIIVVLFWILRNIPLVPFSWLAPV